MININYVNRDIYTVNSLGYRAPEFTTIDWSNSFIIQGCSQVFGESTLDDTLLVNYHLSDLLGAPVINLGVSGSGMEVQYVNSLEMLEQGIKPKGVFIVYPNMDRYSLFADGKREHIGPWSEDKKLMWMLNNNSRTHNINLMRGYRLLWSLADIPLVELSHHKENKEFCKDIIEWDDFLDRAPDGDHWGPITAKRIAEILYQMYTDRTI